MNAITITKPAQDAKVFSTEPDFRRFADLGYQSLVPVTPPDARISERSSLRRRIGTKQDARGKVPGVCGADGCWHSFDWINYQADERDLTRWGASGAGVGVKTGGGLVGIDADTLDEKLARTVFETVQEMIGQTPVRIGQSPKALYVVRTSGAVPYQRVEFGPVATNDQGKSTGRQWRVELLSDGRFFVAEGMHPKTRKPYTWPKKPVPYDQLPIVTPETLTALLERLRTVLPDTGPLIKEGSTSIVSQAALTGDLDSVREAVEATPNTSEHFSSRESYRDMGYAIKAALPDNPAEALALFEDWCARWKDGDNDPRVVAADWSRMKPPYRRGASWLYEQAERLSGGAFSVADVWFDNLEVNQPPPSATRALDAAKPVRLEPTTFKVRPLAEIPQRRWIYGQHLIRGFVSTTVAPGGLGKSSLIIVEGLAMASGKPLLGVEPRGQFRVWLWNGEDPADELERRVAAAMQYYGLSQDDIGNRLLVDSGRSMEIVLARQVRGGATIQQPVANALEDALRRRQIDVMQIDPFISSHRVRESDNDDIDLVVKQWGRIAGRCGVAVELVHHVRKTNGQETTVEDARGAGALINAARSARVLTRMSPQEAKAMGVEDRQRRFFRFGADAKNNLAPLSSGSSAKWFELQSVNLANGQGGGLDAILSGDSVGVVSLWAGATPALAVAADASAKAFEMIEAGEYRMDVRAGGDWVGHAVAAAFGLVVDDPADKAQVKAWIAEMIRAKRLEQVMKLDRQRKRRAFVRVVLQSAVQDIFN